MGAMSKNNATSSYATNRPAKARERRFQMPKRIIPAEYQESTAMASASLNGLDLKEYFHFGRALVPDEAL